MKSRNKLKLFTARLILICFLYMLSSPLISAVKVPKIVWRKVPGARFYQVEIRRQYNRRLILRRRTNSTTFKYKLPYGKYQVRISAFSRSGQMGSKSPWINIQIKKPIQPGIQSVKVKKTKSRKAKVEVSGKNFEKGASVYIKEDDKVKKVKKYKLENGKITFSVNKRELKKNFKVVVKNPGDLKSEKAPLENNHTKRPQIDHIVAVDSASSPNKKQITIQGSNFKKGSLVFIKKGNKLIPVKITQQNDSEITFSLDKTQTKGKLQIIVKNPGEGSKNQNQAQKVLVIKSKKSKNAPIILSYNIEKGISYPNISYVTIKGKNFQRNLTEVSLSNKNQILKIMRVRILNKETIRFSMLSKDLENGLFKLKVMNKELSDYKVFAKGNTIPEITSYILKRKEDEPELTLIKAEAENVENNALVALYKDGKKLPIQNLKQRNTKFSFEVASKLLSPGSIKLFIQNKGNNLSTEKNFHISNSFFQKPKSNSAIKMKSFGIYGYTKVSPSNEQGIGIKTTLSGKNIEIPLKAYTIGDKYTINVIPKYFLFTKKNNLFISFLSEVKKESLQIGVGAGVQKDKSYSAALWFTYYPYYWEENESKRIAGLQSILSTKQGRWLFLLELAFGLSKIDYYLDSVTTKSSAIYFDAELEVSYRIYSSLFLSAGVKASYDNSSALLKSEIKNSAFDSSIDVILIYGIRFEF